jgi:hypothetical protein
MNESAEPGSEMLLRILPQGEMLVGFLQKNEREDPKNTV